MRLRLSILMFMQYAPPGAMLPLYSLRLEELGFTPFTTACCCATQALATVLASLIAGQIADRWVSAERCLTVCAFLEGIDLLVLAGSTSPRQVFATTMIFWLLCGPSMMLGTTICFTHLAQPEKHFGRVRLWGTAGWMTAGWAFGLWLARPEWLQSLLTWFVPEYARGGLADTFRMGAGWAFILGFYGLTLPRTPPTRHAATLAAPLAAMRLLRRLPFAVYFACTFVLCVTLPFTAQATPLLLKQLGVPRPWLLPTLTLAQVSELLSLALLPTFLLHLGTRRTMILGQMAWLTALSILAIGQPVGLVIFSLAFNGLCISGFFVAGQVFVNSQATGDMRASVQGLLTFANGSGMLLGNLLVGVLRDWTGGDLPRTFLVGAVITGCLLAVFFIGFHPHKEEPLAA